MFIIPFIFDAKKDVKEQRGEDKVVIFLVGNKTDLVDPGPLSQGRAVSIEGREYIIMHPLPFFTFFCMHFEIEHAKRVSGCIYK